MVRSPSHERNFRSPGKGAGLFLATALVIAGFGSPARASQGPPEAAPPIGLLDVVRLTLAGQPAIRIAEQQVRYLEGSLLRAEAPFDVRFGSSLTTGRERTPRAGLGGSELRDSSLDLEVDASRTFRSGLSLTPSLAIARRSSNQNAFVDNRSRLAFSLRQPLLRGRGAFGIAAESRAAALDRDAAVLDLRHETSARVLDAVSAYWAYAAELRRLEITRESEQRFVDLQVAGEKLVAAREVAAVDLKQLTAILTNRRIERIEAEQAVFEARARLGLVAGLDAFASTSMGRPGDPFMDPEPPGLDERDALIGVAIANRADIEAARVRERSADVSVGAAENATRAQLDVVGGVAYAGQADRGGFDRFLAPLGENVAGPSASAGVVFSFPAGNRAARGRLAENQALLSQSNLARANLERTAGLGVTVALNAVVRSAERARVARESSRLYREALDAERQRQQLGLGTVLDVINTEDRLNESLSDVISADLDYAQAVARLRFETGTLIHGGASTDEIDFATLTRPPRPGTSR